MGLTAPSYRGLTGLTGLTGPLLPGGLVGLTGLAGGLTAPSYRAGPDGPAWALSENQRQRAPLFFLGLFPKFQSCTGP
jgi:hypothetical protein